VDEVAYRYDAANRMVSVAYSDGTGVEYQYDPTGNRLSATVTYPPAVTAAPEKGGVAAADQAGQTGEAVRSCDACGTVLVPDARFCSGCGAPVAPPRGLQGPPAAPALCPSCGAALRPGARFCSVCGGSLGGVG
jgi:YD repeat-containing protein